MRINKLQVTDNYEKERIQTFLFPLEILNSVCLNRFSDGNG